MMTAFERAVSLLNADLERSADQIHDLAVRSGLSEAQQERVMQRHLRKLDELQAKYITRLKERL